MPRSVLIQLGRLLEKYSDTNADVDAVTLWDYGCFLSLPSDGSTSKTRTPALDFPARPAR